eukprot:8713513-Alexandrium_andersonii.AAC.1
MIALSASLRVPCRDWKCDAFVMAWVHVCVCAAAWGTGVGAGTLECGAGLVQCGAGPCAPLR